MAYTAVPFDTVFVPKHAYDHLDYWGYFPLDPDATVWGWEHSPAYLKWYSATPEVTKELYTFYVQPSLLLYSDSQTEVPVPLQLPKILKHSYTANMIDMNGGLFVVRGGLLFGHGGGASRWSFKQVNKALSTHLIANKIPLRGDSKSNTLLLDST